MKFYVDQTLKTDEVFNCFVSKGLWLGKCLLQPTTFYRSMNSLQQLKEEIAKINDIAVEDIELYNNHGELLK